jgi:hypothetical protein
VIFLVIIGQFYNIIYSNVIARGRQFIESREEGICDRFGNTVDFIYLKMEFHLKKLSKFKIKRDSKIQIYTTKISAYKSCIKRCQVTICN